MQGYCQRPNEYRLLKIYCIHINDCSHNLECVDGVCVEANFTGINLNNYIYSIDILNREIITSIAKYKFSNKNVDYFSAKNSCLLINSTLFYPINQIEFDVLLSIVYQLENWFWVYFKVSFY